jgi:hypothetical protein
MFLLIAMIVCARRIMSNLLDVVERVAEAFYKQQLKVANSSQQQSNRASASNDHGRCTDERHNNSTASTATTTTTDNATLSMIHRSTKIPQWIVRAASEQYRILATRLPVGSIDRTSGIVDSAERRAAALLEYCARTRMPPSNKRDTATTTVPTLTSGEAQQPLQLSWSLLGAAIHVTKTSTLSQLQHQLVHFMTPTTTTTTTTTATATSISTNPRGCTETTRQSLRTRPLVQYQQSSVAAAAAAPEPHLLPTLVLRLAGHLLDPHRVLQQARQLWFDLQSYYDDHSLFKQPSLHAATNATERRGHLYDLQRYAAAYQAAILYHVAVTTSNNTVGGGTRGSGTSVRPTAHPKPNPTKRKFSKWNDEALNPDDVSGPATVNHHHDNGASERDTETSTTVQRPLQLTDLVEASIEFTFLELQQVLPRVQELAGALKEKREAVNGTSKEAASLRKSGGAKQQRVVVDSQTQSAKRRSHAPGAPLTNSSDAHADKSHGRTTTPGPQRVRDGQGRSNGDGAVDPSHTLVSPSLSFYDLKDELLTSARNQARQNDATLTDNDAIACAADAILRKHGILA